MHIHTTEHRTGGGIGGGGGGEAPGAFLSDLMGEGWGQAASLFWNPKV